MGTSDWVYSISNTKGEQKRFVNFDENDIPIMSDNIDAAHLLRELLSIGEDSYHDTVSPHFWNMTAKN